MSAIPVPSVHQPHAGNAVLVIACTARQVDYIAINESTMQYSIHYARVMEFIKAYIPSNYSVAQFALRAITSAIIPASQEVETIARRIIMENSAIVVVNVDGTLVGRFADTATTAAVSNDNTLLVTCGAELKPQFSKAAMLELLAVKPEGKQSHDELAELLFAQYMSAEVAVPVKDGKAKKEKAPKEAKAPSVTVKSTVRALLKEAPQSIAMLVAGCIAVVADFPAEAAEQEAKVQTPVNNLRAELELVSFTKQDGEAVVRFYVPKANATPEQLAKPVKQTDEEKQTTKDAKAAEREAAKAEKEAAKAAAKAAKEAAKATPAPAENSEQPAA